jgi:hypothetical protein
LVFPFVLLRPFETVTGVGLAFEGLVRRFCDDGNDPPDWCAFIPAATGSPNPTMGSSQPAYYGGQADPPTLEDQPLSQEEIDRIRQGNGIPKGGLF